MSSTETRTVTSERRYVRWREDYDTPLWPIYAAVLGLILFLMLASAQVQSRTQQAADRALDAIGADWADARASGRTVRLYGQPPDIAAGERAEQAVRNAEANTWLFGGTQPTNVIRQFGAGGAGTGNAGADADPTDWTFSRSRGVLRLMGTVPDEASRASIVDAAQLAVSPRGILSVRDELNVADRVAPPEQIHASFRAIALLNRCPTGEARFADGVFSFTCDNPTGLVETLRASAEAPLPYGEIGEITINSGTEDSNRLVDDTDADTEPAPALSTDEEAIEACDRSLADLLNVTRIQFASGSAVIEPASVGVLDRVAAQAEQCPGTLRIEGHTDNQGPDIVNDDLSRRRAAAVRNALIRRGVDGDRLISEGFGSRVPIASNLTETGRAQNRRIEIKVVRDTP